MLVGGASPAVVEPKARGRPEASIEDIAAQHLERFLGNNDAARVYFRETSNTQQRSISRYIVTAGSRLLQAKGEKGQQLLLARKRLQVIESSIKLHQKWVARKSVAAAAPEFMAGWATLLSFCAADPAMDLN